MATDLTVFVVLPAAVIPVVTFGLKLAESAVEMRIENNEYVNR